MLVTTTWVGAIAEVWSWLAASGLLLQEAQHGRGQVLVQHPGQGTTGLRGAHHYFRCLVEGRAFSLYTDHKQQCLLAYVAEYTADIQHGPGVENVVADALSRPPAMVAVVQGQGDSRGGALWCGEDPHSLGLLLPRARGSGEPSPSQQTMIDCSTRWPEAVPLRRIDMDTVLEAFITTWVARFGVPACITTDRGTHFTSGTWGDWCQKQGVQHITTTAYHPQANGMVVRIHRTLKAALCACGGANA